MVTSTENYTKKTKKTNKRNRLAEPSTNGKSKVIQTKSHREVRAYTLTKREKGKYIYIFCSQSPLPQIGMLSIQVFHRCRVHQVDCGDLIHCS